MIARVGRLRGAPWGRHRVGATSSVCGPDTARLKTRHDAGRRGNLGQLACPLKVWGGAMAVELVDDNDVEVRADPTTPMAPNGIRRLALVQLLPGRARLPGHGHRGPGAGSKGGRIV